MCTGVWFIHLTSHVIGLGRLATLSRRLIRAIVRHSPFAGEGGPITREPIGAAKRARRQAKNRDETLLLRTLKLNLDVTCQLKVRSDTLNQVHGLRNIVLDVSRH